MNAASDVEERPQTLGEEIANSVSHGVGLVAGLVAAPFLITAAFRHSAWALAGASIFAGSMVALYLASTVYHALSRTRARHVLRVVDHAAIYVLIAGSYTPFALTVLRGPWGWTLLAIVWSFAVIGVLLKMTGGLWHPRWSTAAYLGMGWIAILALRPLWQNLPLPGFGLLIAGGLSYTVGVAFFHLERLRYSHFIWHLFVLAGTACHFLAVFWSVA
ncbi:MAG: PAQR family membrane homeostasis protein TrhA [Gemmatimonadota bacterium]